jgi:hypothetical protein
MNTRAQQKIPGYRRRTPLTAPPDYLIRRGDARRLQAEGKGVLLNHGKAFRMWASDDDAEEYSAQFRLRDASCCIGDRIIEANAGGDRWAMAIAEGWNRKQSLVAGR